MAIALVVAWNAGTGQPGDPVAIDNGGAGVDTTGAQLIAVTVGANDSVTAVTDNKGNSYSIAGARSVNGDGSEIWYSVPTSVGAGHTISVNMASSAFTTACAAAYNGFSGTVSLDQAAGSTGTSTSLSSGNVTTTVADELLIGSGTHVNTSGAFTAGASFTIRAQYSNSGDNATGYIEDRVVSATGTYSAGATVAGNSDWAARIATFKGSGGGGAAAASTLMLMGVGS